MGDIVVDFGGWGEGAVGFDFDVGKVSGEFLEEGEEFILLEEGLAAGDDEAVDVVGGEEGDDFGWGEFEEVFGAGEFFVVGVRPGGAFPVPGEGGVAPNAVEVAEGETDEDGGLTEGGAFAL